jgi:hypothetical protein
MERVVFLVEETLEHIRCLLNPEGLDIRRRAGVRERRLPGGAVAGAGLSDEPLQCTGGGTTDLRLDLLFDTDLDEAGTVEDVRDLSGPLSRLAETTWSEQEGARLPVVRFIWGKQWNIPGVVTAVAERLESFTTGGIPHRSWLRLRFRRIAELDSPAAGADTDAPDAPSGEDLPDLTFADDDAEDMPAHEVIGDGEGERLDTLAYRYYGDPDYWRVLAHCNGIDDPQSLPRGTLLRVPPLGLVARRLLGVEDEA